MGIASANEAIGPKANGSDAVIVAADFFISFVLNIFLVATDTCINMAKRGMMIAM